MIYIYLYAQLFRVFVMIHCPLRYNYSSMIYDDCNLDFVTPQCGGSVPSMHDVTWTSNFISHLRGFQTQQNRRTSRLPTKRLLFFLPKSMLLMPTWYWCNKTRPDFYGNSLFFFAVCIIVRVETYPGSGNQWQFFVGKILWLLSLRKALGSWQYFCSYFQGKKGKRQGGRKGNCGAAFSAV